uniref:Uncharacterized protein n=1 Tax=Candidatus Nitrotoga fabula TaxID=2182327 RepID=A0A2X0QV35_9PROT|nr:protein of unknown function [Candidatus Nitrotoga fabula]
MHTRFMGRALDWCLAENDNGAFSTDFGLRELRHPISASSGTRWNEPKPPACETVPHGCIAPIYMADYTTTQFCCQSFDFLSDITNSTI